MNYNKRFRSIFLIVCTVIAILIQVAIVIVPNNGNLIFEKSGEMYTFSLRGVLQSICALVCVFMVTVDPKRGIKITRIYLGISTLSLVMNSLRTKSLDSIPGAITVVLSMVSCEIIARQLKRIEAESITDFVTRLYNRRGLIRELEEQKKAEKNFHMMFVHIRNIKVINDNLGYEYGDMALSQVAQRINEAAGEGSIVSKLDGTEFAIALPEMMDIKEKALEIMDALSKSVVLMSDGVEAKFYLQGYAGVATYPEDANSILKLMRYADIAMYHASKSQDERIVFFNKNLEQELLRRSQVERYIQESIKHDYFFLVYQPQFHSNSKKLRGFETLIRMKLPDGTNVSPGEFIPIAEKTDLIFKIDDYVMRRAMKEFADVEKNAEEKFLLSINISAKDISNPEFPAKLRKVIDETEFPPECLEVEITEYSLYDSLEQTVSNIKELRSMGVKLALDDFGTGYTSLAQLLKLPFDLLKIDKSLVDNIETSEVSRDFVNLVIYMGHIMNSEVISEGVESESQLKLLKDQECDFIQGYVWSRPLSYEDAKALCR